MLSTACDLSFCVSIHVRVCVSMHAYSRTYTGVEATDNLRCHPSGVFHLFCLLWDRVFLWPEADSAQLNDQRTRDPPVNLPITGNTSTCHHTQFFTWRLGIKLTSSCLHSKNFIDWAISVTCLLNALMIFGWTANVSAFSVRSLVIPLCSETRKAVFQFSKLRCVSVQCRLSWEMKYSSEFTACPVDNQLPQQHSLHGPFSLHSPPQLCEWHSVTCTKALGSPKVP